MNVPARRRRRATVVVEISQAPETETVHQVIRLLPGPLAGIVSGISTEFHDGRCPKERRVTCRWFGEVACVAV
jgi:hypothetical protein